MPIILQINANTKEAEAKIRKAAKSAGASVKKLEQKSVASSKKMSIAFKGIAGALATGFIAIRSISALIDRFGAQEKAVARLDANVKNVLVSFRGFEEGSESLRKELKRSTEELKNQARELQRTTTFGDEQTISAQAMLSTFALTTNELIKLTPALLDMAAASEKASGGQVDLEQIAIAIGKSLTIGVGSLTRYGVVISDAARASFRFADQGERVNIILGELNKNFSGVAEAIAQTDVGRLDQLGNVLGDLGERAGGVAARGLVPLAESLIQFIDATRELGLATEELVAYRQAIAGMGEDTQEEIKKMTEAMASGVSFSIIFALRMKEAFEAPEKVEFSKKFTAAVEHLREEEELRSAALAENLVLLRSQVTELELMPPAMAEQSVLMRNIFETAENTKQLSQALTGQTLETNLLMVEQLEVWEKQAQIMGEKLPADAQKFLDLLRSWRSEVEQLPLVETLEKTKDLTFDVEQNTFSIAQNLLDAAGNADSLNDFLRQTSQLFGGIPGGVFGGRQGFFSGVSSTFRKLAGFGFQHGTDFAPGGPALVGESGPEIVNLPRGAQVIPNNQITNNATNHFTLVFPNVREIDDFELRSNIMPRINALVQHGERLTASDIA